MLALMAGPPTTEDGAFGLQQLALPLADLVGMNAVLAGSFIDRFQTLSRFQGELELELGALAHAFVGHRFNPTTTFIY
jgi:hypothetical protein